jgi:hypothetical protein
MRTSVDGRYVQERFVLRALLMRKFGDERSIDERGRIVDNERFIHKEQLWRYGIASAHRQYRRKVIERTSDS